MKSLLWVLCTIAIASFIPLIFTDSAVLLTALVFSSAMIVLIQFYS